MASRDARSRGPERCRHVVGREICDRKQVLRLQLCEEARDALMRRLMLVAFEVLEANVDHAFLAHEMETDDPF